VKCPKCNYLGFETGDRCKNCGYDFSLMSDPEAPVEFDLDIDLALRSSDDTLPASVQWDDNFEPELAESPATREIADPLPEPVPEPPRDRLGRGVDCDDGRIDFLIGCAANLALQGGEG